MDTQRRRRLGRGGYKVRGAGPVAANRAGDAHSQQDRRGLSVSIPECIAKKAEYERRTGKLKCAYVMSL